MYKKSRQIFLQPIQVSGILKPKLLQMFHKLMVCNGGFCWFESHES